LYVAVFSRDISGFLVKCSGGMCFVSENYTQGGRLSLDPDPLLSNKDLN